MMREGKSWHIDDDGTITGLILEEGMEETSTGYRKGVR